MLIGTIRSTQSRTFDVTGSSIAEIHERIHEQIPEGWVLTDAPVAMLKGSQDLTSTARIAEHGKLDTIEASDMDALHALVPDGFALISVLRP